MRLLSGSTLGAVTIALALSAGCSGGPTGTDTTDSTGGLGGEGSGGEGSGGSVSGGGGQSSTDDGSGGDGLGGEGSGGAGTGGGGLGGDGSGGDGLGGDGSGGAGSGGDGSGGGSGNCIGGDTQPGTTPCGSNGRGTLVQGCDGGVWIDSSVCDDGEECVDDAEQTLTDVCGFNDRGDIDQTCTLGYWSGSDCDDPDECVDDAEQTLTDVCGFNDRGDIDQTCVLGLWDGSSCDDPDECEDGDDQTLTDVCGFNDRGDVDQTCDLGVWDGTTCDDPDECEDASTDTQPCLNGSGEQGLTCESGAWVEGECDFVSLYRASVDSAAVEGNAGSRNPVLSANGRYVAFQSSASNLALGDTNGAQDIFVHDVQTGATERVSLGSINGQNSSDPSISADGRYVAFQSDASDLVAGDDNGTHDVFVHDLDTSTTTRISVTSAGAEVSGGGESPKISGDGRYVIFRSLSTVLVTGDTNSSYDAFLHDRTTGTTTRVSTTTAGVQANAYSDSVAVSADGRYVAFHAAATNLVSDDTNGTEDVFVRDLQQNTLIRASVSSAGVEGNGWSAYPALSSDGRYVAFHSSSDNLVSGDANAMIDVFVRDTVLGTTERVSVSDAGVEGNLHSVYTAISGDGRFVAFQSGSQTLVPGKTSSLADVFVRDRLANTTRHFDASLLSTSYQSGRLHLSADGRFLTFSSLATTLVSNDDNGVQDVFLSLLE